MIKSHYDPEADAFTVNFSRRGAILESEEVAPGIILDFDSEGLVVGIEVLDVRKRMASKPRDDAEPEAERMPAMLRVAK